MSRTTAHHPPAGHPHARRPVLRRPLLRRLGVVLALAGLVLGLTSAVQADEPDLTLTGRVLGPDGVGVGRISVYAISDTTLARIEAEEDESEEDWDEDEDEYVEWDIVHVKTAPSGRFSITDGRLTQEGWTFAFVDERDVVQPFAITERKQAVGAGTTDLGDTTLRPGAVIDGLVRGAVTKKPVRYVSVLGSTSTRLDDEDLDTLYDETNKAGRFRFAGLDAGVYRTWLLFDEDWRTPTTPAARVRLAEGQVAPTTIDVTVPCETSFSASPAKGKVTFRAAASAAYYGITSPRGKVTVKRGTKVVKTLTLPTRGSAVSATIAQAKGKATYTATYSGGDCRGWTAKRGVTVR